METYLSQLRVKIIELNLFESGLNNVDIVQRERWSTRLYLFLLIIGLVILVAYTGSGLETIHVTVQDPALSKFETLQLSYPNTLKCPCSEIAIKYGRFVQMKSVYHQVCSSSFVTQEWISSSYAANVSNIWPMDVRTVISAHAQVLRAFCTNSETGISTVLINILSSSLITANAMPLPFVQSQVDIQKTTLQSAGKWQTAVLISFLRLVTSSSHLLTGLGTNSFLYIPSSSAQAASIGINAYQLSSNSSPCYCLTTNGCAIPGAIYSNHQTATFGLYNRETLQNYSTPVKGIQAGCFALESALASSLECYYDATCLALLVPDSRAFPPLQSTFPTRYDRTTTIGSLMDELMVEDQLVNMSFASYYSVCAPKICAYSFNQRNSVLIILTTILALIGGLNTVLHLLIPLIVKQVMEIKKRLRSSAVLVEAPHLLW